MCGQVRNARSRPLPGPRKGNILEAKEARMGLRMLELPAFMFSIVKLLGRLAELTISTRSAKTSTRIGAMNEGVGDERFPNNAGNLRLSLSIKALIPLYRAGVGNKKAQRLLEHIGKLASYVATIDVTFVLDLRADKGYRLDYKRW